MGVDDSTADNAVDPMASQLQMLNFEIALRRSDPNVKDCLRKVWDGGRARSSYATRARPSCHRGRDTQVIQVGALRGVGLA